MENKIMEGQFEITRIVHSNPSFSILGAIPINDFDNKFSLNQYGNVSLRDNNNILQEGRRYKLTVRALPTTKYGTTYEVQSVPDLEFKNIDEISPKLELNLLMEIMTERQAKCIHEAYPDFVKLVLKGRANEMDYHNIKFVDKIRFNDYVDKVGKRCKYFILKSKFPKYDLSNNSCKAIFTLYNTIEEAEEYINKNPYHILIDICNYSLTKADRLILSVDPTFKYHTCRVEYMILHVCLDNETNGSTYMNTDKLVGKIGAIDEDVIPQLLDVVNQSEMIHYEAENDLIQRTNMYKNEKKIAEFIRKKVKYSTKLDWKWDEFTEIKDGELTEEQQNVLKMFCEYGFVVLDSAAGTGKSSTMMAVLQMIERHGLSYNCLTPTGKASARLAEQTGREVSTIHRACCGYEAYSDVVIVDEFSMLSVDTMCMIIDTFTSPNTRFLFIGDTNQIPSISVGRIAKDMTESGIVPTCALTKCFRFKEGGASYVSALTRQGEFYLSDEQCEQKRATLGAKQDYEYIAWDGTVDQITDEYMKLIRDGIDPKDICLLVPYNKGEFGATRINNMIQKLINPVEADDNFMRSAQNDTEIKLHEGDMIMNIKNNYNALPFKAIEEANLNEVLIEDIRPTEVFNGQIGVVEKIEKFNKTIQSSLLVANIESEEIAYTPTDAYHLLLSWATNPYKFQGSQAKYIINVVIPHHSRSWNRQLLYTSQTRMSEKLIEIGDINTMRNAVEQMGDDKRKTRLKEMLINESEI